MSLDINLISLLVCPETRKSLSLVDSQNDAPLIDALNKKIKDGLLKNKAGRVLSQHLSGVLMREDREVAYPILGDIPIMLVEESIALNQ